MNTIQDVIIIGAGAAGIGVSVILQKLGIDHMLIDKEGIGASFKKWPEEMRFISPSFTGNAFGNVDLNAITPNSSPAHILGTEHPSGKAYATYLEHVAKEEGIPKVQTHTVHAVTKEDDIFTIHTDSQTLYAKYIVWAAGEFQYPQKEQFPGDYLCLHNSKVSSWKDINTKEIVVIGGYESGIDAAIHLAKQSTKVTIIDSGNQLNNTHSDSSFSVSPYTKDRFKTCKENITIITNTKVTKVEQEDTSYIISLSDNTTIQTQLQPILATGFATSLSLIEELFSNLDTHNFLTQEDESTKTKGLFLAGPQVRHQDLVFCFVYKYRQRFPIVAKSIAKRLNISEATIQKVLQVYEEKGMVYTIH
ncbi:MAG: NAD(P)-binding domain-containing protein [Candidatus Woesearchaeota archaeon]